MPVLALGITGHRFLAETGRILQGIDLALARLQAQHPGAVLRAVSSLAQGADSLFAERVLALPGAQLWVPLPLPEEQYLQDFTDPAARQAFRRLLAQAQCVVRLPPAATRSQAYLAAGKWMLANSQVLFAVWDGAPARGRGGTGAIVALARRRRMPLAWVHAGNRPPGATAPLSLGMAQGRVTFENFPGGSEA